MRFYNESKHNIKKRHFLEKCLPNKKALRFKSSKKIYYPSVTVLCGIVMVP